MDGKIIVVVTEFEYEKAREVFEGATEAGIVCIPAPKEEDELAAAIRGNNARHVVLGVEPYREELYDSLPRGGVIARFGVGYDAIDIPKATRHGILCVNTPGVLEESVAEYTFSLILSAARHLQELDFSVRNGSWAPRQGTELRGKRLAVIGCGLIGGSVTKIASAGFGMEVVGCDIRYMDKEAMKREFGYSDIARDFAEAVADADFVTLHIPSTPATRHFINTKRLSLMPEKAWLINTARGAVVDESALYDALESGSISGAALDVFENEPYTPVERGKDLRNLKNVIMTPHVASSTVEACNRVAERALANIRLAEKKEYENMDLLNPEVLLELRE